MLKKEKINKIFNNNVNVELYCDYSSDEDKKQWYEAITKLMNSSDSLKFIVSAIFSTCLVRYLNLDGFVLNIYGNNTEAISNVEKIISTIYSNINNKLSISAKENTNDTKGFIRLLGGYPVFFKNFDILNEKEKEDFAEKINLISNNTLSFEELKNIGKYDIDKISSLNTVGIVSSEEPLVSYIKPQTVRNNIVSQKVEDVNLSDIFEVLSKSYGFGILEFAEKIERMEKKAVRKLYFIEIEYLKSNNKNYNLNDKILNNLAVISLTEKLLKTTFCNSINDDFSLKQLIKEQVKMDDFSPIMHVYNMLEGFVFANQDKFEMYSYPGEFEDYEVRTGFKDVKYPNGFWGIFIEKEYIDNNPKRYGLYINPFVLEDFVKKHSINFNEFVDELIRKRLIVEEEYPSDKLDLEISNFDFDEYEYKKIKSYKTYIVPCHLKDQIHPCIRILLPGKNLSCFKNGEVFINHEIIAEARKEKIKADY